MRGLAWMWRLGTDAEVGGLALIRRGSGGSLTRKPVAGRRRRRPGTDCRGSGASGLVRSRWGSGGGVYLWFALRLSSGSVNEKKIRLRGKMERKIWQGKKILNKI